jgi:hypothetical protein
VEGDLCGEAGGKMVSIRREYRLNFDFGEGRREGGCFTAVAQRLVGLEGGCFAHHADGVD